MDFGIEAASFYVPHLYLEISELAEKRGIDPLKLEKGLGLKKMAFPDVHEDAATFAAEALLRLIRDYGIHPKELARVYLGTESALDGAKPTASYAVQMVEEVLAEQHGVRSFKNCDVVDMTFACIGGVDALQNSLDFVRCNPEKKAVVIASDYAKYELGSGGEYTQGGGAVALLISADPKLMVIEKPVGVGMESVFDFFKPRRPYLKTQLSGAPESYPDHIEVFTDEPVFDGQYSNECFKERIREAYDNFKQEKGTSAKVYQDWRYIFFHLPYAFHGKRIFSEIYALENDLPAETKDDLKAVSKSEGYRNLVEERIEPTQHASSEIGNMYTASIFMGMLSALSSAFNEGQEITGTTVGFVAYGSGSKAKIFEGKIGTGWQEVVSKWMLFEALHSRKAIDFETYEKLHRKQLSQSVDSEKAGFRLEGIEVSEPHKLGARYYKYHL